MEKFRSGYPQIDRTQVRQFTHKTLQTANPNHTKQGSSPLLQNAFPTLLSAVGSPYQDQSR